MKRLITIYVIGIILAVSGIAQADLVDPDSFSVGTDISNAFTGVTL